MSRYVTAKEKHICTVCKQDIEPGDICIQSQARWGLFYHENCYNKKYQGHGAEFIVNERPEVK